MIENVTWTKANSQKKGDLLWCEIFVFEQKAPFNEVKLNTQSCFDLCRIHWSNQIRDFQVLNVWFDIGNQFTLPALF